MCVCVCVCVYVCVDACECARDYECLYACVPVHVRPSNHLNIYAFIIIDDVYCCTWIDQEIDK